MFEILEIWRILPKKQSNGRHFAKCESFNEARILRLTLSSSLVNAAHHGEMLSTCHAFSNRQIVYIFSKFSRRQANAVSPHILYSHVIDMVCD
jgi:hypothetical protein